MTGVYRKKYSNNVQYFDKEIIKFESDKEIFIACGAFQGEIVTSFIEAVNKSGINEWSEIIAVETDLQKISQMKERLVHCKNISIEEAVILDKNGYVLWADE